MMITELMKEELKNISDEELRIMLDKSVEDSVNELSENFKMVEEIENFFKNKNDKTIKLIIFYAIDKISKKEDE